MTKIKVTETDIRKGIPQCENACPIALALRRHFKTKDVIVHFHHAKIDLENWNMSGTAAKFVKRFDNAKIRRAFKPFSFCITKSL